MKKTFFASFIIAVIAMLLFAYGRPDAKPASKAAQTVLRQADSFSLFINNNLLPAAKIEFNDTKKLQAFFLQARLLYKKFEWAAEYFTPTSAKHINGAPVPNVEDGQVYEPQGLQVIEGLLFPAVDTTKKQVLVKQLELLPSACAELESYFKNIDVLDWQIFDAAKLQVFRIETLGITGFDAPLAENSMQEAAYSLASLQAALAPYDKKRNLGQPFSTAIAYLLKNTGFNYFNRAVFITNFANPLTKGITQVQQALHKPAMQYSRLLRQNAATLFDTGAFNPTAYAPGVGYSPNAQQTALGEMLFKDPIMSGTGTRSCASCHNPAKCFADGLVKNKDILGNAPLARNTPTLLNAALQPAQFYDMRVYTLEEQVTDVVQNHQEMGGNMLDVAARIWQNKTYRQLFAKAFPVENRTEIDTAEITHAIAEYVRTLTSLDSRFDEYMRGDTTALSTNEVNGFNLFMGKAKCGTCHYMPLFNGTLPPNYMTTEPEVIGVPALNDSTVVDGDLGRFAVLSEPFYQHAFKTPTVRNAYLTAPYMHNGVFKTLYEVVDFYNKGGGRGMGLAVPYQTLPENKLQLTVAEMNDLVDFIKCLTGNKIQGLVKPAK